MKYCFLIFTAAIMTGCTNNAQPTVQNTTPSNRQPAANERPQTVTAHTTENQPPATPSASNASPSNPGKWASGGEPINTARFDGTIAAAEKIVKSKPNDAEAKNTLADAYFDRGMALTEARQYASALGDYRRALKNNPANEDAKEWIDQIVSIYKMLKKEPPKEGEEPPPLPFDK